MGAVPRENPEAGPLVQRLRQVRPRQEYHAWEVKSLGRQLRLLASSDTCRVQAFVHRRRPVYGVQFHPEQSSRKYPDGFKVLRNFFRLARAYRKAGEGGSQAVARKRGRPLPVGRSMQGL